MIVDIVNERSWCIDEEILTDFFFLCSVFKYLYCSFQRDSHWTEIDIFNQ